jgi:antitoxin component of MazEF toxin-antitoxin module
LRSNIRKWGNSSGAIIPAAALARSGLKLGESVDIIAEQGRITIKSHTPEYSLDDLLAATPVSAVKLTDEDKEWLGESPVGLELI